MSKKKHQRGNNYGRVTGQAKPLRSVRESDSGMEALTSELWRITDLSISIASENPGLTDVLIWAGNLCTSLECDQTKVFGSSNKAPHLVEVLGGFLVARGGPDALTCLSAMAFMAIEHRAFLEHLMQKIECEGLAIPSWYAKLCDIEFEQIWLSKTQRHDYVELFVEFGYLSPSDLPTMCFSLDKMTGALRDVSFEHSFWPEDLQADAQKRFGKAVVEIDIDEAFEKLSKAIDNHEPDSREPSSMMLRALLKSPRLAVQAQRSKIFREELEQKFANRNAETAV